MSKSTDNLFCCIYNEPQLRRYCVGKNANTLKEDILELKNNGAHDFIGIDFDKVDWIELQDDLEDDLEDYEGSTEYI